MFDLSWIELIFCAILALVVVGPKDMPKLLKIFANSMRQIKRFYADFQASMSKLEKEVHLTEDVNGTKTNWQNYLPEDVKRLPDDYLPGQMSADEYQTMQINYQNEVKQAKMKFETEQTENVGN